MSPSWKFRDRPLKIHFCARVVCLSRGTRRPREKRETGRRWKKQESLLRPISTSNQFAPHVAMLSKVIHITALGRKSASSSLASSKPATKLSGRSSAAIRRQVAIKQARRGYASISVAGGTASAVVEDKIVRQTLLYLEK